MEEETARTQTAQNPIAEEDPHSVTLFEAKAVDTNLHYYNYRLQTTYNMDFSSPTRALESLSRRRPVLPDDVLQAAQQLSADGVVPDEYLKGLSQLLHSDSGRWEALAVGLLLATEVLVIATYQQQPVNDGLDKGKVTSIGIKMLCRCFSKHHLSNTPLLSNFGKQVFQYRLQVCGGRWILRRG